MKKKNYGKVEKQRSDRHITLFVVLEIWYWSSVESWEEQQRPETSSCIIDAHTIMHEIWTKLYGNSTKEREDTCSIVVVLEISWRWKFETKEIGHMWWRCSWDLMKMEIWDQGADTCTVVVLEIWWSSRLSWAEQTQENHAVARDPIEIYWKVRAEIRKTVFLLLCLRSPLTLLL